MMKQITRSAIALSILLVSHYSIAAEITGFVGHSAMQVAPNMTVRLMRADNSQVVDIDETNFFGKYTFEDVSPGYYKLQVGDVTRELMIKKDGEEKRLDIDLSAKAGTMDYGKAAAGSASTTATGPARSSSASTNSSAPIQNDQTLASQIAGVWWGYAGSTERRIGLCPGGIFMDYTESSYSGGAYNNQGAAWGAASQASGQGKWGIQGDTQSGVISVRYNNGATDTLHYRQINNPGCLDINGNTLCRSSATCQ